MNWQKIKNDWTFRSLAFLVRVIVVILFLCYIVVGVSATLSLVRLEANRKQDISILPGLIQKAVARDMLNEITAWVRFRPLIETGKLIEKIKPESGWLSPDIFFELSRRNLQQGHPEDALFWSQLARYRLRYDTLRCGASDSAQTLEKMLQSFSSPKIQELLQQHPELVKKSVRQVLDFDARYPARNSPTFICALINKIDRNKAPPVPKEQWQDIRHMLRSVTESSLKQMDEKKSK